LSRPALQPTQPWYWPLGVVGGAGTAALSLWFARQVLADSQISGVASTLGETIAIGVATVLVAPVAEEYFFRGWLQRAIAKELPLARKPLAFAIAALAFALAHVGSYGLPQLLVGLVAGALYARGRGLGPAIVAHAVHNGLSLWWLQP
jgi:membrane protease YdiL (CAAX protease family)